MKNLFCVEQLKPGLDVTTVSHVAQLWDGSVMHDLLRDWEKIDWKTVCYWQYSINKRCSPIEKDSNRWALQLFYNSCTVNLREQINVRYKPLPQGYKGGVMYTWVLFHCLFAKSRDTTAALKKFLKVFEQKGLQRIKGENVVITKKEMLAVCRQLFSTGEPQQTTIDILKGLKRCSMKSFQDLFDSNLQDATKTLLELTSTRPWGHDNVYNEVAMFMMKAVEYYHNLHTANQWNIPKGHKFSVAAANTCWNCGDEGHGAQECPKPFNKALFEKNKREFYEKRNGENGTSGGRGGGDRSGGRGRGCGRGGCGGKGTNTHVTRIGALPRKGTHLSIIRRVKPTHIAAFYEWHSLWMEHHSFDQLSHYGGR
mmetsp:Transcript_7314/g.15019  ORF Transcript_7314/g.15019 Transcript_7314/m.15019 type:complete len:368 (+) Transcript_7314:1137-2240(+)